MALTISQKIRRARQREGLTQLALAETIGVTQGAVAAWEGGNTPRGDNRLKLEEVLGPFHTPRRLDQTPGPVEEISSFGAWLREKRIERKLSVPELAQRAGVSPPAIYNIENGRIQNPQAKTQDKLAAALRTNVPLQIVNETVESQGVRGLGSLTDFQPHDEEDWPRCAGVYVLYDVSQRPIYVGRSDRIDHRLKSHADKFWFKRPVVDYASFIEVADNDLRNQLEQALIRFLKSNAVINNQSTDDFD